MPSSGAPGNSHLPPRDTCPTWWQEQPEPHIEDHQHHCTRTWTLTTKQYFPTKTEGQNIRKHRTWQSSMRTSSKRSPRCPIDYKPRTKITNFWTQVPTFRGNKDRFYAFEHLLRNHLRPFSNRLLEEAELQ